jgi:translocation and assembly module TamB
VLSSRPVGIAMVLRLTPDRHQTRSVIDEDGTRRGRLQGRIAGLPAGGALFDRLRAGDLFAQLRYNGPADALWRLAGIEAFDLTGPISIAADVTGTLADPRVRGAVASKTLRVRSTISGTDLRNVDARGVFSGSRLQLTRFAGTAPNGGTVVGSGTVDLTNLGVRGPQLDIKLAANNARILDANGLSATVSGPMRIVSDGIGGTIAGRLLVERASWRLGTAAAAERLPQIKTREINLPYDIAPARAPGQPWRYMIDARAPSRVDVDGMGLDSEWSANIRLRGTTDDPRIGGTAEVIRGDYTFAGTQFELTRGKINFDDTVPIDPRLDIVATTERDGLSVTVKVQGNAAQPEISFTSSPALPEEEILARLLFGGSITELSATDVLQLGSALASLRGGGGLDPINKLRSAIGLDRLRIVSADPAIGRGTGVALGKNIGRKFYVEIITDGRGYSATSVEFRITSWLSLLGTVSTIGRDSLVAQARKDY